MAEIEEDIGELECLDLDEMIKEKNKAMNKTMNIKDKNQLLSSTLTQKQFASTFNNNYQENPLFKETRSFDADVTNYLKETEEANLMLSDNFTITGNGTNKEKESLTEILKSTIQRSKQSQEKEEDPESASLMSTLKIDKVKEEMNQTTSLYTD